MSTDPRRRAQPPPPPPPPETEPDTTTMGLDGAADDHRPHSTTTPVNGQPQKPGENPPPPSSNTPNSSGFKLKFCTVCASNNNRSMEAHLRLTTAPSPYPTISFGTGSLVRLPGPSITQPNVYTFNRTSYANMHDELAAKDARLYRANGILPMLERNKGVKWGPERWQDWRVGVPRVGERRIVSSSSGSSGGAGAGTTAGGADADASAASDWAQDKGSKGTEGGTVDVVITCEERCWDSVVEDLMGRGAPLNRPVHVFNVDIKDNHEEALVGGRAILELADALNAVASEEREEWVRRNGGAGAAGAAAVGFDEGISGAREGFDERVPDVLAKWQERWPTLPALWTLAWF